MNQKTLFALWGASFVLCAGLGFIPNPEGAAAILLTLLAASSFVPPLMLVYGSHGKKGMETLKLVRSLALLWLVLTTVLIIANFLASTGSETVGNVLYSVLVIVSSPMICGQYWVMSLFGWAYVMFAATAQMKKL